MLALGLIMLVAWSCEDKPAEIGAEIFGGNLIDTRISISSGDTIRATNTSAFGKVDFNAINYLMIGEYNDSVYGSISAGFASEFSLGNTLDDTVKLNYNEDYEYLGTELRLQYTNNSWIGDTLAKQKVTVYRLQERLDPDMDYHSDFDPLPLCYPAPIGTDTFEIKNGARDTLWQTANYVHNIAIAIDDAVGLELFEADSAIITNSESFKNLFKGVYVTAEKIDDRIGSVLRIPYTAESNLSQQLAVIIRRRNILTDADGQESIAYDTIPKLYPINKEATKTIRYTHDYTNTNIDFTGENNVDKIYVQGMGGTRGKINITDAFISKWKEILPSPDEDLNGPITSVASVELSFYLDTLADKNYKDNLPEALNLYVLNSNGNFVPPSFDLNLSNTNVPVFTGGKGANTESGDIKYTFSMQTGFFEEFIHPQISGNSQKKYQEFYLGIPAPEFNFNRVVLHGMNIEKVNSDETLKSSNLAVRYVVVD